MDEELIIEQIEGLAIVRFNRPDQLNALSPAILAGMARHVPRLVASPDVRAIMMTGTGRAFCAGGDISGMGGSGDPAATLAGMKAYHPWLKALRLSDKPVISAVNGAAAGGGFGLAMLADLIVASEAAFFKAAFTTLGVAADFGLAFTLPRAVGEPRAAEILFSDRRIPAGRALELGLVGRVFPAESFAEAALQYGLEIARAPKGAQLTKRLFRHGEVEAFSRFLDLEAQTQTDAFQSLDFREGVAAFIEKRSPRFQGG
jgi:2-(1,2-epoxy-1,2-dihydrophenyl)acetyl-CoA isomerase